MKYHIDKKYIHRQIPRYWNDIEFENLYNIECQKEVYEYAKQILIENNLDSVLDYGCGSAKKLLRYFDGIKKIGIDVPETVDELKKLHPQYTWSSDQNPIEGYDLLIASDVIEHIENPDKVLEYIKKCNPKHIILSTPERYSMPEFLKNIEGPPINESHCREWSFTEFKNYISDHFIIIDHFISNIDQGTQVIHAKLKEN